MLYMAIQTVCEITYVRLGGDPKYKGLTRAYNDILLILNQIPDENLLAVNQIIT